MNHGQLQTEFKHCYFTCDPFKQKDIAYLLKVISGTRLNEYLSFDGYASIKFAEEDTPHRFPTISTLDENGNKLEWNRKTSNCLMFNMNRVEKNTRYDKLFLYHTCSHNGNGIWYGWLAYDAKEKRVSHKFFVPQDTQDLMQSLNRMIHHIPVLAINEAKLEESRRNSKRF